MSLLVDPIRTLPNDEIEVVQFLLLPFPVHVPFVSLQLVCAFFFRNLWFFYETALVLQLIFQLSKVLAVSDLIYFEKTTVPLNVDFLDFLWLFRRARLRFGANAPQKFENVD